MAVSSCSLPPEHSPPSPGEVSQPLRVPVAKQGQWEGGKAGGGTNQAGSKRRVREREMQSGGC